MKIAEVWVLGYVANGLWQLPLLFGVAWALAKLLRPLGAKAEHRVWVATLFAQVLVPACTISPGEVLGSFWSALSAWFGRVGGRGTVTVTTSPGTVVAHGLVRLPAWLLASAAVVYAGCLAYFLARILWRAGKTSVLRRRSVPAVLEPDAAGCWERCTAAFGVAGAVVRESSEIAGPATIGICRRVMLVPRGWLACVGTAELEAGMAHECAHMARYDFAKNVVYDVISLAGAWHPVVWMTRARITESREMICDGLAAEMLNGRQRYARALLRLASMAESQTQARTLHAIGIFDANHFERRVMRLTEKQVQVRGVRQWAMAAVCIVAGLGSCASAMALRMTVGAPGPAPRQEESAHVPRISGGVMAGNMLTKVNPVYPQAAKDAKVQGVVVLRAIIGKDGTIQSLRVVSGPTELAQSAVDAVQQWVYKPYLLNGEPTEVDTTITVNYSLAN